MFAESPVFGDVVSVFGFVESPGLDGVVLEVNLGMLFVFVAPQVLQVYVLIPSASFVASFVTFPSSQT